MSTSTQPPVIRFDVLVDSPNYLKGYKTKNLESFSRIRSSNPDWKFLRTYQLGRAQRAQVNIYVEGEAFAKTVKDSLLTNTVFKNIVDNNQIEYNFSDQTNLDAIGTVKVKNFAREELYSGEELVDPEVPSSHDSESAQSGSENSKKRYRDQKSSFQEPSTKKRKGGERMIEQEARIRELIQEELAQFQESILALLAQQNNKAKSHDSIVENKLILRCRVVAG